MKKMKILFILVKMSFRWWSWIVLGCLVCLMMTIGLMKMNDLDVVRINERRQYFPKSIARVMENKYIESLVTGRIYVFSYLDWDLLKFKSE